MTNTMNSATPMTKNEVAWDGRRIEIRGHPLYRLPKTLAPAFIEAILLGEPGDPFFWGELAAEVVPEDRVRLARQCKAIGGQTFRRWSQLATAWAPVVYSGNKWDITRLTAVYRAQVNLGWAREVMVTNTNLRFVLNSTGVYTLPEFEWRYGQDVLSYLVDQQRSRQAELERVRQNLEARLVTVRVQLRNPQTNSVEWQELRVLESQRPDDWYIPPGYRLYGLS